MQTLEDQFHEAMINVYKLALEECNYRAKTFLGMVIELGGLKAAKKLLSSNELQSGLYELYECGRLDLTVETLVCEDEFRSLFSEDEIHEAERRIALLSE